MLSTNPEFINEYKEYDELMEFIESTEKDLEKDRAMRKYQEMQFDMMTYFESPTGYLMEFGNKSKKEDKKDTNNDTKKIDNNKPEDNGKDGLLSTIGKKIMKLISLIGSFIKRITDTLTGRSKKIQTDVQIVNKIITEHPDLKNAVAEGIDKEWFTYGDIAKYKDNVIELMSMLKQNKISHRTFSQKITDATEGFRQGAGSIVKTVGTVGTLLIAIPTLISSCQIAKESMGAIRDGITKNKDNINGESLPGVHKATSAVGEVNKKQISVLNRIGNWLDAFIKKHGDKLAKTSTRLTSMTKN